MGTLSKPLAAVVRRLREELSREDGCVSCLGKEADVLVRGERYCWDCVDTWPAGKQSLDFLGVTVLPGRERPEVDR